MGTAEATRLKRFIWLEEDISPLDTPPGVSVKLVGTYNRSDKMVTIYLIIDYKGTEYRLMRYHKRTTMNPDPATLRSRYAETVQSFIRKYEYAPFNKLLAKFLKWSSAPAHQVLKELL